MTFLFNMCKVSARRYSWLLSAAIVLGIPSGAIAQTTLNWAKVETLRNRVHLIPSGRRARRAQVSDVMRIGDALRTAVSARAELRFNDGSLARVGEQATFRFTPNTRNFQLSNGTVLLLIPPGYGRTTIQTPNAVTGIQGSALFVRVRCLAELSAEGQCDSPVTIVGALTNNPAGAMIAFNETGSQQQPIYAGEMVVIEGKNITESLEFDLRTFYETSGLVEGLDLDSNTPPADLSEELQDVWKEIQDALELQGNFDEIGPSDEVVVNPSIVAPPSTAMSLESENSELMIFASFPAYESSPADVFHNAAVVATSPPTSNYAPNHALTQGETSTSDLIAPVTSARAIDNLANGEAALSGTETAAIAPKISAPAPVQITTPQVAGEIPPSHTVTVETPASTPAVAPPSQVVITPPTPEITPEPVTTAPIANTPEVIAPEHTTTVPEPNPPEVVAPEPTVTAPVASPANDVVLSDQPVIPDADQVSDRAPASVDDFNLNTPGASSPEVLQTPDLSLPGGSNNNTGNAVSN
ncbi:MAG: FecR domain-containing protein [Cyanobacteria bacterium P01_D01_bin.56]